MLLDLLALAGGLALLYFGAESLVRGAAALALRLGLSPLVVGLTVVALGTSAPELVVSVEAALEGRGGLALGNVVGSNISNVGLILGVSVLLRTAPVLPQLLRRDVPVMVAASVALPLLLLDGALGRAEGAVLAAALVGYVALTLWKARPGSEALPAAEALPDPVGSAWRDAALTLGGLVGLVVGGRFLVGGAVGIAEALGVSEAVVGLTIVAVGTSLPELATSVVASLRGEGDIAVGNVVGSNVFNVLGVLGLSAVASPLHRGAIGALDLGAMVLLAAVVVPLMWTGRRLVRWEGALLLGCYAGYLLVLL